MGRHRAVFCEQKVNLVIGKEKHVVSELPQLLSVNRGNGKIDTVTLIDGLSTVLVFVGLNCHMRSKQRVEKHFLRCTHTFASTFI